jgi:hypothetical protein
VCARVCGVRLCVRAFRNDEKRISILEPMCMRIWHMIRAEVEAVPDMESSDEEDDDEVLC